MIYFHFQSFTRSMNIQNRRPNYIILNGEVGVMLIFCPCHLFFRNSTSEILYHFEQFFFSDSISSYLQDEPIYEYIMVMSVKNEENENNKHQYERSVEFESINEKENTSDLVLKKHFLICVPLICGLVLGITMLVHFVHSFESDDPNVMLISLGFIRFHTEMEYRTAENLVSYWYYFSKESVTLRNARRRCQSLINGISVLCSQVV